MEDMSKRNIYLVQVDILRKTPMFYTAYLPYAVAELWSYARQAPNVIENYILKELIFLRRPADSVAAYMETPFLLGFSCYCWNTEYNKALAQAVKRRFPSCRILFGGHDVPPGGVMLDELPYVDYLIHGEGEICFQQLLLELVKATPDFTAVPGLSWRTNHGTATNAESAPKSIAGCPSPYLTGVFDPIITAHPEIQWSTVWETNRGCPHHCAYCDWGKHNARIRQYPMERLLAEIEWMSANKIEYIWCADANFGILERDERIVDALVAARNSKGYPQVFLSQTTKALNERLFRMYEKLCASGLEKLGPNLAQQSLSPEVLHNIGRENLDEEAFSYWIHRYRQAGYRTHTDIILGLPGETLQSFCAGVEKLYGLGQHEGVCYYACTLLPNAVMANPEYCEKHRIRTMRTNIIKTMDVQEEEPITELMDTIIETASMPHADWLTANYFMHLTMGMHAYGLLRLVAMYFHTEKVASYAGFYIRLLNYCHEFPGSMPGAALARTEASFTSWLQGKDDDILQIQGFSFGRMLEDQYIFSRAVLEPERFYADTAVFLGEFGVEPGFLAQLLRFQREAILLPGAADKTLDFDYDFPAYFNALYDRKAASLQRKAVRLHFSVSFDLSTTEKYYETIVRVGRLSNNTFYRVEYLF